MRIALKWLAWIVGVPALGFGLLVMVALWSVHQRDSRFATLTAPERQLAIYDAFARLVELNYYDQAFIEQRWPALRDQWRTEAARSRKDFDVYFNVLLQLSLNFPTSHLAAHPPTRAPASDGTAKTAREASRAAPGRTGITVALVRRGRGMMGFVDSVATGSPGALAGVEPGWTMISYSSCKVGQQVTSRFMDLGTPEERHTLESTGKFTLVDPGIKTQQDLEVKRQKSVTYTCDAETRVAPFEFRDIGGITYLRLDTFNEPGLIDQAIAALDHADEHGIILDLRSNAGGLRDEELRFVGRLLPAGTLVGTQITRGARTELRTSATAVVAWPLLVLIGPSSASAAEVTAAALQDHHRARLLGRSTAGATLISGHFALPDGGDAQIAMSDFLRPSGARIEAVGVMPDIAIMPTLEDVRAGRDPVLDRALLELRTARTTVPTGSRSPAG